MTSLDHVVEICTEKLRCMIMTNVEEIFFREMTSQDHRVVVGFTKNDSIASSAIGITLGISRVAGRNVYQFSYKIQMFVKSN